MKNRQNALTDGIGRNRKNFVAGCGNQWQFARGKQIWADSLDESEKEIFWLQDKMAQNAANALAFTASSTPFQRPTENLEGYNIFLQGEYLFRLCETQKAATFFKQALELDPPLTKTRARGTQFPMKWAQSHHKRTHFEIMNFALTFVAGDKIFDNSHGEQRFQNLSKKMNPQN